METIKLNFHSNEEILNYRPFPNQVVFYALFELLQQCLFLLDLDIWKIEQKTDC